MAPGSRTQRAGRGLPASVRNRVWVPHFKARGPRWGERKQPPGKAGWTGAGGRGAGFG